MAKPECIDCHGSGWSGFSSNVCRKCRGLGYESGRIETNSKS